MKKDEVVVEWIYERLSPWMRELGVQVLYEPRGEKGEEGEDTKNEEGRKEGVGAGKGDGGEKVLLVDREEQEDVVR